MNMNKNALVLESGDVLGQPMWSLNEVAYGACDKAGKDDVYQGMGKIGEAYVDKRGNDRHKDGNPDFFRISYGALKGWHSFDKKTIEKAAKLVKSAQKSTPAKEVTTSDDFSVKDANNVWEVIAHVGSPESAMAYLQSIKRPSAKIKAFKVECQKAI